MKKIKFSCEPKVLVNYFSYNEKSDIEFEYDLNGAMVPGFGYYIITFQHDDDATAFKMKFQDATEIKEYDYIHETIVIERNVEKTLIPPWYKRIGMKIKRIFKRV